VPCVVIKRETRVKGVPVIIDNDYRGMQLALEHLHGLGHTRIALTGRWLDKIIAGRTSAYRDFLKQHHLPSDERWIFDLERKPLDPLHQWLDGILALPAPPTAVCCTGDDVAVYVLNYLHRRGLKAPAGLAITGYNNDSITAQVNPGITSVNIPVREMIELGNKVLFDLLGEAQPGAAKVHRADIRIEVRNELVVRGSTADNASRGS
jgi:DNA-binding LacI/PurR family transcriptional regulator